MIVKISDLVKKYKELTALDNFNLEIEEGKIFGLLGPNGSGKTTAIKCLLSVLNYEHGDIEIFGEKMDASKYEIKKKIGYVPQEVAVIEELTVEENVDFFCGLYINDKTERKKLVDDAIKFVEIGDFRKFKPKKLSGGLLRRLNIACGIAHKPKLIIFDEPTVAVDPQSRNNILEGIQRLNKEGATILYTSHYMEEVEILCDKICIMDKGKGLITGTSQELKDSVNLKEYIKVEGISPDESLIAELEKLKQVNQVFFSEDVLTIRLSGKGAFVQVLDYLEKNKIEFMDIHLFTATLNDVFLEITGKELRDNV